MELCLHTQKVLDIFVLSMCVYVVWVCAFEYGPELCKHISGVWSVHVYWSGPLHRGAVCSCSFIGI